MRNNIPRPATTHGMPCSQCKVAITGLVCEEFGNPDEDWTGGYHCKRQICTTREYCDGKEQVLNETTGQIACMGKCTPIPYNDALISIVRAGVPRCISSVPTSWYTTEKGGCIYSQNRRYGACMVNNKFNIFDFGSGTDGTAVTTYTMRLPDGSEPQSKGPYSACMEADG